MMDISNKKILIAFLAALIVGLAFLAPSLIAQTTAGTASFPHEFIPSRPGAGVQIACGDTYPGLVGPYLCGVEKSGDTVTITYQELDSSRPGGVATDTVSIETVARTDIGTTVAAHTPADGDAELSGLDIGGTDYEIADRSARNQNAADDHRLEVLGDLTRDIKAGSPVSTEWVAATLNSQGGVSLPATTPSNVGTAAGLIYVVSLNSGRVGSLVVRIPADGDDDLFRVALLHGRAQYTVNVNTFHRIGADNDWIYYTLAQEQIGDGVDTLQMQVTGSAAHVGTSRFEGVVPAGNLDGAVDPANLPAIAKPAVRAGVAADADATGLTIDGGNYEVVDAEGRLQTRAAAEAAEAIADELDELNLQTISVTGESWNDVDQTTSIRVGYTFPQPGRNTDEVSVGRRILDSTIVSNSDRVPVIWIPRGAHPEAVRLKIAPADGDDTFVPGANQHWQRYTSYNRQAEDTDHLDAYFLAADSSNTHVGVLLAANYSLTAQIHPTVHELAVPWDHVIDKPAPTAYMLLTRIATTPISFDSAFSASPHTIDLAHSSLEGPHLSNLDTTNNNLDIAAGVYFVEFSYSLINPLNITAYTEDKRLHVSFDVIPTGTTNTAIPLSDPYIRPLWSRAPDENYHATLLLITPGGITDAQFKVRVVAASGGTTPRLGSGQITIAPVGGY